MKTADIKVGKFYKHRYHGKVCVKETRVERRLVQEWGKPKIRKDGVRVTFEMHDGSGGTSVVAPIEIISEWGAAEDELIAERKRLRDLCTVLRSEAAAIGLDKNCVHIDMSGNLAIHIRGEDKVKKVLTALGSESL